MKKKNVKVLRRFDYVDALRGYSILLVIVVHYSLSFGTLYTSYFMKLSSLGQYGVGLFFLVSAYTLTKSLNYRFNEKENQIFKKYFLRRFFRIAPLYYLYLLYHYFFLNDFNQSTHITNLNFLAHFIFLDMLYIDFINSILHVEWTIGVEVFFYLFLPFFFKKSLKILVIFLFITILISMFTLVYRKYFNEDYHMLHFTILEWSYYFIAGTLLAKWNFNFFIKNNFLLLTIIFNIALMSIINLPFQHYLMFITLILFFIYIKEKIKTNIYNNIIIFIGKISFSIYLSHYIVLRYTIDYFGINFYCIILSLVITLIISIITFYVIEQPFIRLSKFISKMI